MIRREEALLNRNNEVKLRNMDKKSFTRSEDGWVKPGPKVISLKLYHNERS